MQMIKQNNNYEVLFNSILISQLKHQHMLNDQLNNCITIGIIHKQTLCLARISRNITNITNNATNATFFNKNRQSQSAH